MFQKWLHALEQEPTQILEVSAELVSQCFLDYMELSLFRAVQRFTVVMLYSYSKISFRYPNIYSLRYNKFFSSSIFLLCGLWLHTLSITWDCMEQDMNSTGPISFVVRSVSVQEECSSIIMNLIYWAKCCSDLPYAVWYQVHKTGQEAGQNCLLTIHKRCS